MALDRYLRKKSGAMDLLATAGVIGLHMVTGPLTGFAIGYGLDYWLNADPWMKLVFSVLGIAAGFKNVYDDSRRLLRKMQADDDQKRDAHS